MKQDNRLAKILTTARPALASHAFAEREITESLFTAGTAYLQKVIGQSREHAGHCERTAKGVWNCTGDIRLTLLAILQDVTGVEGRKFRDVANNFGEYLVKYAQTSSRQLLTPGDARYIQMHLSTLNSRDLREIVSLDRSERPVWELVDNYADLISRGTCSVDILRRHAIADLAGRELADTLEKLRNVYKRANISVDVLKRYGPAIAFIYGPADDISKSLYPRYGQTGQDELELNGSLYNALALSINPKGYFELNEGWYKIAEPVETAERRLREIFAQNTGLANEARATTDGRIYIGTKEMGKVFAKALTDKWEHLIDRKGNLVLENIPGGLKDLVRCRAFAKTERDAMEFLSKVALLFKEGGLRIVQKPHIIKDKDQQEIWRGVLVGEFPEIKIEGKPVQVEIQVLGADHEYLWEFGDRLSHPSMLARKFRDVFDIPSGVQITLDGIAFRRIAARAIVLNCLANKRNGANIPAVFNVQVEKEDFDGGMVTRRVTLPQNAIVADALATVISLDGPNFRVIMDGRIVKLTDAVSSDVSTIGVERTGKGEGIAPEVAKEILVTATMHQTVYQAAGVIFEREYNERCRNNGQPRRPLGRNSSKKLRLHRIQ